MKLYVLKVKDKDSVYWECNEVVIVRAENARNARKLASTIKYASNSRNFLDPKLVSCTILRTEGPEEVICVENTGS